MPHIGYIPRDYRRSDHVFPEIKNHKVDVGGWGDLSTITSEAACLSLNKLKALT
jgi:hypothetical protein